MNPWLFLKGEWACSRGGIAALALILALAVSLGIGVSLAERALRQGMTRAADNFTLLLGAPGSPVQLVLGAVYLRPENLSLIPAASLHEIRNQSGTAWAAPLAFGDRFGDAPLVGTTPDMVTLGGKRTLAQGRVFERRHEAVVGASVPLEPGQSFTPAHGRIALPDNEDAAEDHGHGSFTVTGRLPATGTPWDNAVLVPVEAVWDSHDLLGEHGELEEDGLLPPEAFAADDLPGISALVVQPASIADAYKLRNIWNSPATQAVFSGEVLVGLFATLGDVRGIMQAVAAGAQIVALGSAVLAAFFAVALRRDTLALLRALGAPRLYLLCCVWLLVSATLLLGGLGGLGLGLLLAKAVAAFAQAASGVALPVSLSAREYWLCGLFFLCGSLCAFLPAALAWRKAPGSR